MKEFREKNSGRFDAKSMMKEGAKAWNIQKGGNIKTADVPNPPRLTSGYLVENPKKISQHDYFAQFEEEVYKKPDITIQLLQGKTEKDFTNQKGHKKLAAKYRKYVEDHK